MISAIRELGILALKASGKDVLYAAVHTKLTEEDLAKLLDGLWNGTKNLISRSKAGQQPRLLLRVVYREQFFHLGELDKLISFKSEKNDEEIRDIGDGVLNTSKLADALATHKDKIAYVELAVDNRLCMDQDLKESLTGSGIKVSLLQF